MAIGLPAILAALMLNGVRNVVTNFIVQNSLIPFPTAVVLAIGCARVLLSARATAPGTELPMSEQGLQTPK